jgi:hypothetical protein
MRALIIAACAACAGLSFAGCGTASRYEYYDYAGQTVDQKNAERTSKMGHNFNGLIPPMGGSGRAGR